MQKQDIPGLQECLKKHLNSHADRQVTVVPSQHPPPELIQQHPAGLNISDSRFYLVSCYNSWLRVEEGQTKKEGKKKNQ